MSQQEWGHERGVAPIDEARNKDRGHDHDHGFDALGHRNAIIRRAQDRLATTR